jgi:hypothetical protein
VVVADHPVPRVTDQGQKEEAVDLFPRQETIQIGSYRKIQREVLKDAITNFRAAEEAEVARSAAARRARWDARLKSSPFTVDQLAAIDRSLAKVKAREAAEARAEEIRSYRERECRNLIFSRAIADDDALERMREDKRRLLLEERLLRASRDVRKTEMRMARVEKEKFSKISERQSRILERELLKSNVR